MRLLIFLIFILSALWASLLYTGNVSGSTVGIIMERNNQLQEIMAL